MLRRLVAEPPSASAVTGSIPVPASKYHAHRALILGSLAEGCSSISGRTGALHVRATLAALRRLGTRIIKDPDGYRVWGGPYRPLQSRIAVGSSGSTLQFLLGLGCQSVGPALIFDGEKLIRHRPIGPLLEGLRTMGVRVEATEERLPVTIYPGRPTGGRISIPGTLSQWISGLLLLAPFASEDTFVDVEGNVNERPYLDLTMEMMRLWGVEVIAAPDYRSFHVPAGQRYLPANYRLPADLSSAAFGLVAAAVLPSDVTFYGVERETDHPERKILEVLAEAGVPMEFDDEHHTLRIRSEGRPSGLYIDLVDAPDLLPILAVFGAMARGKTVLDHVAHARLKESDRVTAMLQLRKMGVQIDEEHDRLVIHGVDRLRPAEVSSFGDHRVLMAYAIAGNLTQGGATEISYPLAYRISYPEFIEQMRGIGLSISVQSTDHGQGVGPWASLPTRTGQPVLRNMMPPDWMELQRGSGLWPERVITDYMDDAAAWTPDRPAVVDTSGAEDRVFSYRQLQEAVDRVASALIARGVRPGEPVAFQLPNWWEFTVLQLALVRCGAVSCPLMPLFRERELSFILRQSGCRFLVVPQVFRNHDYVAMAHRLQAEIPTLEHIIVARGDPDAVDSFEQLLKASPDSTELRARRPAPDALVQLLYTSGTSGEPKGVLHTHNTLLAGLKAHVRHFRLTDRDSIFIPSPAGHQTGFLYGVWLAIVLGATAIFQDIWEPRKALHTMDTWHVAFVQAATPFLSDLTEAARHMGRGPAGLRIFVATGAPVPRILARMAKGALHCDVVGGWGTTESGLVAAGAPGDPPDRLWQTDGRVLEAMGMRVVDEQGLDLPPGTEGRFLVRTPAMFVGYLGHEDWYAQAFTGDRWFDTGDLATLDPDGYMRITGRTKDIINRGGEKVPAAELEECLYAHPAVAEVAVVGMPDPRLGERACAYVVLRPGSALTLSDVQRHLSEMRMAKQYWPERLEVIAEMPRTPSGKIQKYLLRRWIAERLTAGDVETGGAGG